MERIYESVMDLVGETPLLRLHGIEKEFGLSCRLLGKLEAWNPAGSAKDRIARQMILDAEQDGTLKPGSVLIEPTSGNTGIGLAAMAAAKGYRTIFVMPETMSVERQKLLKGYGAEIVLTEGKKGMPGAIEKAEELLREIPDGFMPGQFENPSNPKAHYETTGPEIYRDTEGTVNLFVAAVGTGGTITGTAHFLKEKNPAIRVIAVEPEDSPVLSGGRPGPHKIQGIGAGFIPKILDTEIYDEVITAKDEAAFEMAKKMAVLEGVLVGISSGAALYAAVEIAKRGENEGKTIVVLLTDTGERYLSTPLFSEK
jgi:cysteine synthase A